MTSITKARNFYIDSLDGIRAVAAMLVFLAHAGLEKIVPGGFGVTVFFFLSGYLITTLLRLEYEETGAINLKNFYLRRVYRICPPMYIVLLLDTTLALSGAAPNDITWAAAIVQFAHLTNYYLIFSGTDHVIPATESIWSLAVEEHFYLLYPFALTFLLRPHNQKRIALMLIVCCTCILIWRCYLVFIVNVSSNYTYMATDARIDSLLFGCVLGATLNPALGDHSDRINRQTSAVALVAGIGLLFFSFIYRSPQFRESLRYTIQGIALFPVFYCAVRYSTWPIFRWLNFRWLRRMGMISYTFYLIHLTTLGQMSRFFGKNVWLQGIAGFILALVFSVAMYFLIEGPLAAMRRRLHPGVPHKDTGNGGALIPPLRFDVPSD